MSKVLQEDVADGSGAAGSGDLRGAAGEGGQGIVGPVLTSCGEASCGDGGGRGSGVVVRKQRSAACAVYIAGCDLNAVGCAGGRAAGESPDGSVVVALEGVDVDVELRVRYPPPQMQTTAANKVNFCFILFCYLLKISLFLASPPQRVKP